MDLIAILKEIGLATLAFAIVVGPFLYIISTIPTGKKKDKKLRS
jgi:hypothetical protein